MSGLLITRALCYGLAFLTAVAFVVASRMHWHFPLTGMETAMAVMPLLAIGNAAQFKLKKEFKQD